MTFTFQDACLKLHSIVSIVGEEAESRVTHFSQLLKIGPNSNIKVTFPEVLTMCL